MDWAPLLNDFERAPNRKEIPAVQQFVHRLEQAIMNTGNRF
jgi:hypothetical protein